MFCQNCGKQIPDETKFCHYCGAKQPQQDYAPSNQQPYPPRPSVQPAYRPELAAKPRERVFAGIAGVFMMSLAGMALMILTQFMHYPLLTGYVTALFGAVMAAGAFWCYSKLAGRLSVKGIFICAILLLILIYVGHNLAFGVAIWRTFCDDPVYVEASGGYIAVKPYIKWLDVYLEVTPEYQVKYQINLVLEYVFAVLGAIPTVIYSRKRGK